MALGMTVVAVLVGYVLGAVPVGVLVCRPLGKDPRRTESGRTGGTNVYRTAGLPAAAITAIGDVVKGYAAVAVAYAAFARAGDTMVDAATFQPWAMSLAGTAAILGHNHSVFAGFRGGAGTSPNVGAVLRVDPMGAAASLLIAGLALVTSRIAAVASLVASTAILVVLVYRVVTGYLPPAFLSYAIGQLLLVSWALRPNLARLRAGTERRVSLGQRPDAAS